MINTVEDFAGKVVALCDAMDGLVVMCPDNPELRNSGDVEKPHSMGEELLEFSKSR